VCPNGPKRSGHRKSATRKAFRRGVPLNVLNGTPLGTSNHGALRAGVPLPSCVGARACAGAGAGRRAPAHPRDWDTCAAPALARLSGVHHCVLSGFLMGLKEKREEVKTQSLGERMPIVSFREVKTQSLREMMPIVAAWVDEVRAAFGVDVVDSAIRAGMRGERTFFASENGYEVGTCMIGDEIVIAGVDLVVRKNEEAVTRERRRPSRARTISVHEFRREGTPSTSPHG
jgi:hypothetical protein